MKGTRPKDLASLTFKRQIFEIDKLLLLSRDALTLERWNKVIHSCKSKVLRPCGYFCSGEVLKCGVSRLVSKSNL